MRSTKGVLLVILAAFLGVALASFHEEDWGSFWRVRNLCGPIGATIAGSVRMLFGPVFSWFWPLFIFLFAILIFKEIEARRHVRSIVCAIALLIIVCAIVAIFGGAGAAGLVGLKTLNALRVVSGRIGSSLILAAALLIVSFLLFPGAVESLLARLKRIRPSFRLPLGGGRVKSGTSRRKRKDELPEIPVIVESDIEAGGVERRRNTLERNRAESPPKIMVPARPAPRAEETRATDGEDLPLSRSTGPSDAPLPSLSLLDDYEARGVSYSKDDLLARSEIIEQKLRDYGLDGKIQEVRPGPVVTTFEFVPAPGVKVSQIASRTDDISLALAARSIRIQAPIPGRGAVGIEVPNPEPSLVSLKELLEHYPEGKEGLAVALGKTVTGEPFFADLADMPHLLIAGATGSGKSVCINAIICSLLFHHTPATCKFILVDPKRLELISYNDIPHLLHPVITEAKIVLKVLHWLTIEMDRRYKLLASVGVKNIQSFNRKVAEEEVIAPETGERIAGLPYYVTVIDELADIMVMMGNEIYPPITRLSQMARAVGIHLVFATQRPSVDVVTGLIKANFPCRLAFQVTSKTDSRTILDANGAENLLGMGDMLFQPPGTAHLIRVHGCFVSEAEIKRVVDFVKKQGKPNYEFLAQRVKEVAEAEVAAVEDSERDEFYQRAVELVQMNGQASTSFLQRRLRVGYNRAARMIEMMEEDGIVGPADGSKPRQVLVRKNMDGTARDIDDI